jgi:1-deoxy-D-xylulose-5-phosphate synthase
MYQMLNTAFETKGVFCVRYPRGTSVIEDYVSTEQIQIGKADVVRQGADIAILAFGTILDYALEAAESINATVVDMRFVKPLDETLLIELSKTHTQFISIEDNAILGGAGSSVSEFFHQQGINTSLKILGLPDIFTEQGTQAQLHELYSLDAKAIIAASQA